MELQISFKFETVPKNLKNKNWISLLLSSFLNFDNLTKIYTL